MAYKGNSYYFGVTMNHEKILMELKKWFQDKDLIDLSIEYNHNGTCTFVGTINHMPQYEYQWMYMQDGLYKITSCHYTDKPTSCSGWCNLKRLDESKRIKKCH